ncbi:uncharacterized protein LOC124361447 [Homalodisca vitripennis]|uniref:uncharacterized protein LOC124361447 n=1 Tax=Homalodisca vitripennis TaxID=197043 RepID=UPI001EEB8D1A|nr:uncharacterized protein LOC124361447 [Homalodisca vitripennis]KAG8267618.1 hypothetical protein J6590_047204 [Homalodisca vitripennis]
MIFPVIVPVAIEIRNYQLFTSNLCKIIKKSCSISLLIGFVVLFTSLIDLLFKSYDNELSAIYLMCSFLAGFALFSFLGVMGAVRRDKWIILAAFVTWLGVLLQWLCMCCILFAIWDSIPNICINRRCPDNLWMSDFYWQAFRPTEESSSFHNYTSNSTQTNIALKKNSWYLNLSILIFLNFMFYLSMLGSMLWNYFQALCTCMDENQQTVDTPVMYVLVGRALEALEVPSKTEEKTRTPNVKAVDDSTSKAQV